MLQSKGCTKKTFRGRRISDQPNHSFSIYYCPLVRWHKKSWDLFTEKMDHSTCMCKNTFKHRLKILVHIHGQRIICSSIIDAVEYVSRPHNVIDAQQICAYDNMRSWYIFNWTERTEQKRHKKNNYKPKNLSIEMFLLYKI